MNDFSEYCDDTRNKRFTTLNTKKRGNAKEA